MRIFASLVTAVIVTLTLGATTSQVHAQEQQQNNNKSDIEFIDEVEVDSGDTLSAIAREHDTTYVRLFNANEEIEHPDVIFPGDKVGIPHQEAELKQRELPQSSSVKRAEPAPKPQPQPKPTAKQPAPTPAKKQVSAAVTQPTNGVWDRLAQCESGGNWAINTGNGYYGGLQFSLSSWRAVGGTGYPHQASKAEQINRAEKLQAIQGWGAWPACTAKLGIR